MGGNGSAAWAVPSQIEPVYREAQEIPDFGLRRCGRPSVQRPVYLNFNGNDGAANKQYLEQVWQSMR